MTDNTDILATPSSYNYDKSSYIVVSPIVRDPTSGRLVTADTKLSAKK